MSPSSSRIGALKTAIESKSSADFCGAGGSGGDGGGGTAGSAGSGGTGGTSCVQNGDPCNPDLQGYDCCDYPDAYCNPSNVCENFTQT